MKVATLVRGESKDAGTFGILVFASGWWRNTLELPWRDNKHNFSCIPEGEYLCRVTQAGRTIGGRRDLYLLEGVEQRVGIRFHAGTWAGDREQNLRSNSLGCILLGRARGIIAGQIGLIGSRLAIQDLMDYTAGEPFGLTIKE